MRISGGGIRGSRDSGIRALFLEKASRILRIEPFPCSKGQSGIIFQSGLETPLEFDKK